LRISFAGPFLSGIEQSQDLRYQCVKSIDILFHGGLRAQFAPSLGPILRHLNLQRRENVHLRCEVLDRDFP
jgi:hypothetical protein